MPKHHHETKTKPKPGPKHPKADADHHPLANRTLDGVVEALNFSPKGGVEGLLLRDGGEGGIIQVNFPPDAWPALAGSVAVGQAVRVAVADEPADPKHPEGDHPVSRLVEVEPASGPIDPGSAPTIGPGVKVEGIVARLNFARHGEANGVVLDGGDFVHLKPGGMKALGLRVGQAVAAEGTARPMALGHRAIEAESVNGVAVGPKRPVH